MSLFLQNLPKSFFRSVVSSRPVFKKATYLFESITGNANRPATVPRFPLSTIGTFHPRSISFGTYGVDRKKLTLKKYGSSGTKFYSKRPKKDRDCKKTSSAGGDKSSKVPKKSSAGNVKSSGAVTCTIEKGNVQCVVDCNKIAAEKKSKEKPKSPIGISSAEEVQKQKSKSKTTDKKCKTSKSDSGAKISKLCKKKDDGMDRIEAVNLKDLTGTWMSRKCIKYDFSCPGGIVKKEGMRPSKVEDEQGGKFPDQNAMLQCKKTPSKASMCTRTGCEEKENHKKGKSKECVSVSVTVTVEDKSAPTVSIATKKKNKHKEKSCTSLNKSKKVHKETTIQHSKKAACRAEGGKNEDDKPCKPCSSKKSISECDSKTRKPDTKRYKNEGQDEPRSGKNTKLTIVSESDGDKKCADKIEQLTKELEECRSSIQRNKGQEGEGECQPSPKLDRALPKPKAQEKDVINGSKNFIKSVCDGIFPKQSEGKKGKSEKKNEEAAIKSNKDNTCKDTKTAKKSAETGCKKKKEEKKEKKVCKTEDAKTDERTNRNLCEKKKVDKEKNICKTEDAKADKRTDKNKSEKKKVDDEKKDCGNEINKPHDKNADQRSRGPCDFDYVKGEGAKECKKFPFLGCPGQKEQKEEAKKVQKSETDHDDECGQKKSESIQCSKEGSQVEKRKCTSTTKVEKKKSERKLICPDDEDGVKKKKSEREMVCNDDKEKVKKKKPERKMVCTDDEDRDPSKKKSKEKVKPNCKKESKKRLDKCMKMKKKKSEGQVASASKIKDCTKTEKNKAESKSSFDHICSEACIKECNAKVSSRGENNGDCGTTKKKKMSKFDMTQKQSKNEAECLKENSSKAETSRREQEQVIEPCKEEDAAKNKSTESKTGKLSASKSKLDDCSKKCKSQTKTEVRKRSKSKSDCRKDEDKASEKKSDPKLREKKQQTSCSEKKSSECTNKFTKEDLMKMLMECKQQRDELRQKWGDKSKYSGPPDQSPIMQCIALCKKKRMANEPQKGKGVPPRDKKPVCEDKQVFKKLVEFDEGKKPCTSSKQDIKPFVPCQHEHIKPGIRNEAGDAKGKKAKEGKEEERKKSVCKKKKAKKLPKCLSGKKATKNKKLKKPSEECRQSKDKQPAKKTATEESKPSSSENTTKTCPKLPNPCREQLASKKGKERDEIENSSPVICICPDKKSEEVTVKNEEIEKGEKRECEEKSEETTQKKDKCEEPEEPEKLGRKEDPCNKNKKKNVSSDIDPCEEEKARIRAKQKEKCEKENKKHEGKDEKPCYTIEDKCTRTKKDE